MTVHQPITYSCFDVEIADNVAHIRLKRPEAMNTMTRDFWNELPAIVADIDDNARARCIVISSTGKHFSAGMDLSVFTDGEGGVNPTRADRETSNEAFRRHVHHLQDCFSCLDQARMPVLAAIQGGCIGGAVDLTSACDIRYCTEDAFFVVMEINIGMTADVGTFPRLCKLIPEGGCASSAYTGPPAPGAAGEGDRAGQRGVPDARGAAGARDGDRARDREQGAAGGRRVEGDDQLRPRPHDQGRARLHRDLADGHVLDGHMAEAFKAKAEKREPKFPDLLPLRRSM
jgi:enoyl-CoA hydratase